MLMLVTGAAAKAGHRPVAALASADQRVFALCWPPGRRDARRQLIDIASTKPIVYGEMAAIPPLACGAILARADNRSTAITTHANSSGMLGQRRSLDRLEGLCPG
jgi:hypothetical protein